MAKGRDPGENGELCGRAEQKKEMESPSDELEIFLAEAEGES